MPNSSIMSKSVQLLGIVCSSNTRLTHAQITAACGLPKSSTHRLLSLLRQEGLLVLDPQRNVYQPGPVLMDWASNLLSAADLPEIATTSLVALSGETQASAGISVLDRDHVLWLKTVDYPPRHRHAPRTGDRTPVHVCAAGAVLLGFMDPSERKPILDALSLEAHTQHTITDLDAFVAKLAQSREAGVAMCDCEEHLRDVGIAAPVFDHKGDVVASISLWDMSGGRNPDQLMAQRPALMTAAEQVSAQLGHPASLRVRRFPVESSSA